MDLDKTKKMIDMISFLSLGNLTTREEKVLKLRNGMIDGINHSLFDVSTEYNLTRERIRQIECRAIRKFKHPSRSRYLKSLDMVIDSLMSKNGLYVTYEDVMSYFNDYHYSSFIFFTFSVFDVFDYFYDQNFRVFFSKQSNPDLVLNTVLDKEYSIEYSYKEFDGLVEYKKNIVKKYYTQKKTKYKRTPDYKVEDYVIKLYINNDSINMIFEESANQKQLITLDRLAVYFDNLKRIMIDMRNMFYDLCGLSYDSKIDYKSITDVTIKNLSIEKIQDEQKYNIANEYYDRIKNDFINSVRCIMEDHKYIYYIEANYVKKMCSYDEIERHYLDDVAYKEKLKKEREEQIYDGDDLDFDVTFEETDINDL